MVDTGAVVDGGQAEIDGLESSIVILCESRSKLHQQDISPKANRDHGK
jgi:hypothetical protein